MNKILLLIPLLIPLLMPLLMLNCKPSAVTQEAGCYEAITLLNYTDDVNVITKEKLPTCPPKKANVNYTRLHNNPDGTIARIEFYKEGSLKNSTIFRYDLCDKNPTLFFYTNLTLTKVHFVEKGSIREVSSQGLHQPYIALNNYPALIEHEFKLYPGNKCLEPREY